MLPPAQQLTLRSLLDRLIPPDEDPGAWEAGVGDYLLRQFQGDLRAEVDHYRAGLAALEAEALAAVGSPFSTLTPDQQDAILRRVEAGDVIHAWPVDPAQFFTLAVQHAIEGYYSDPGNGGNRDGAAWRMIGFVPRRLESGPA